MQSPTARPHHRNHVCVPLRDTRLPKPSPDATMHYETKHRPDDVLPYCGLR